MIFILQNMGFVKHFHISLLSFSHQLKFLGKDIDSFTMIEFLTLQK